MRAQTQPLTGENLSPRNVSFSQFSTQYRESCTGFPGGRVFYHFSNSTLVRSLVAYSAQTVTTGGHGAI